MEQAREEAVPDWNCDRFSTAPQEGCELVEVQRSRTLSRSQSADFVRLLSARRLVIFSKAHPARRFRFAGPSPALRSACFLFRKVTKRNQEERNLLWPLLLRRVQGHSAAAEEAQ
jgi:hypothetical protein